MQKTLSSVVIAIILVTSGVVWAQQERIINIPNSASTEVINNQMRSSRSTPEFGGVNSGNNDLYTILDGEAGKNSDAAQKGSNILTDEAGKNAGGVQGGHEGEGSKNSSEADKNAGGFDSNKESSKNSDANNSSNKEKEQNDSAHYDTADNKNNDNSRDDENNKNDESASDKQNNEENRNTESQPAPEGTAGNDTGNRGDRASAFIKAKRDYTPPGEKVNGTSINRTTNKSSRTIGRKVLLDHTAGDGSGTVDPNQSSNKGSIASPPAGTVDYRQFSNGNLTGKGFGQPDSANTPRE